MAVDGVARKIGNIESRLTSLEGEVQQPVTVVGDTALIDNDEPIFGQQLGQGAKPKIRKVRAVASDVEVIDSDIEKVKKKKQQERKQGHAVKSMSQEYAQKLNKVTDQTIIEWRGRPAESTTLADLGLLSQREIEELGDIALGSTPQAMQFWSVVSQPAAQNQKGEENNQKDLLDFLNLEQQEPAVPDVKPLN